MVEKIISEIFDTGFTINFVLEKLRAGNLDFQQCDIKNLVKVDAKVIKV